MKNMQVDSPLRLCPHEFLVDTVLEQAPVGQTGQARRARRDA